MSFIKETGEVSAVLRAGDQVPGVQFATGTRARFVAPGSLTAGRFGLFDWQMPARSGGATPHFHRTFSESFYVISGAVQLFDGSGWADAGPGDFLHVPEGGVHGFRNDSDDPASMLILFAPGPPREQYFTELAEIGHSGRQLTDAEWLELWARHDQYPA